MKHIFRRSSKPKILLCAPHNEVKNYALQEWAARATNLTYKNYDILLADNSKTPKNKKMLIKMGLNAVHVKQRHHSNQRYIADSLEELRMAVLNGGYDFMFCLETDIIPLHDIIERLLMHKKAVVSGSYMIGQGWNSHLLVQELEPSGDVIRNTVTIDDGKDILYADGKLHKVYACGMGCMLIHKSVLQQIKFRSEEGANPHPDSFLAADLHMLGIEQYLDSAVLCEHRNMSWSKIVDAH